LDDREGVKEKDKEGDSVPIRMYMREVDKQIK
jgi:hypothetical protein